MAEDNVCSICIEAVIENGERATARLRCNHRFHLDCIASAINVRRVRQCPNCRSVVEGRWIYPQPQPSQQRRLRNRSLNGVNGHGLHYHMMLPSGAHWCPYEQQRLQRYFSHASDSRQNAAYMHLWQENLLLAEQIRQEELRLLSLRNGRQSPYDRPSGNNQGPARR